MCTECGRVGSCHPQCPNADEPKVIETCAWCGEDLYEGDEYYDIADEHVCVECIRDCKKTVGEE